MAKNITKIADYTGIVSLALENDEGFFAEYAFEAEKEILRGDGVRDYGLLGDQVYIALIADLDSNNEPQTAPYINLVDGVNYVANNGENTMFLGLRKLLTYFVYCKYLKDDVLTNFQGGTVNMANENAVVGDIKQVNWKAHLQWNRGVDLYNGETYDYLLFYQSSFTNWNFTRQGKYLTKGII